MPPASRALLVVNPASGQATGRETLVRRIVATLSGAGLAHVDVRTTRGADDAVRWAEHAAADGYDLLLVAGGDGTVAAAAQGVVAGGHDLPIGVLPIGTGNGLARHLRLPEDPLAAARVVARGPRVRLDAIEVVSHDRLALVFVGAGLDAEINRDADAPAKRRLGRLAYVAAAARRLVGRRNHRVDLVLDGRHERLAAHAVSVINAGRFEFAGLDVGPSLDPQDGFLDVAVFRRPGVLQVAGQVTRLLVGRPHRAELLRAAAVRLASDPPMPVHVDGDVVGETPLEARVLPGAVRFAAGPGFAPAAPSTSSTG